MGGMFNCGQCGGDHHTDDVGYHHAVQDDGRAFEFCEPCYMAALAAHLNGDRPLSEFDGKDFATHFVCPDCVDVYPNAEKFEYRDRCGWVGHCCTPCRGKVPIPAHRED